MIRTQVQLTDEQSRRLKTISLEKGVSVAELIRRSIDSYIQSAKEPSLAEKRRRALVIIGAASSGKADLGTNHNNYLAEAFGAHSQ